MNDERSATMIKPPVLLIYGVFVISIVMIVYLLEVFELRASIYGMPNLDDYVLCPDVKMPKKDCFLRVIVPEQSSLATSFLVLQSSQSLILAVYFFCGVFGCGVYFTVLMYKPGYLGIPKQRLESEFEKKAVVFRYLLSGLAGILVFLIIWAAANGLSAILPSISVVKEPPSMQNFFIVPLLSGLFLSIFFDGARQILKKFFSKKRGPS